MRHSSFILLPQLLMGLLALCVATVATAELSVPGDLLYGVKTTTENIRLHLALRDEDRVKMQIAIAEEKLTEIQKLEERQADTVDIFVAQNAYSQNVAAAAFSIQTQAIEGKDVHTLRDLLHKLLMHKEVTY